MLIHKGVYYYDTLQEVDQARIATGCKIVRKYGLGYAVQLHDSGPYLGPKLETKEQVNNHRCRFCREETNS